MTRQVLTPWRCFPQRGRVPTRRLFRAAPPAELPYRQTAGGAAGGAAASGDQGRVLQLHPRQPAQQHAHHGEAHTPPHPVPLWPSCCNASACRHP